MKKRYVLVLLLTSIRLCSYAQEVLTFEKADSLLAKNIQSTIDQKNVEEARASLQQSKNYANPTVQWMHNIVNPTNHQWLDTGKTGEDDIQLSQPLAFFQLPCGQQAIEEQCIQLVCRVEVVGLASVGCVENVILGQFLYGSENRVGTACAKCRMKREVVHQMRGDILYA